MREILFRGKVLYEKCWITGSLYIVDGLIFIIRPHERALQVDVKTVGQYTGLKDKNGKWIFEGDICRFSEWSRGKPCWIGEVQYAHQQFIISGGANEECEVPFVLQMSRFIPECIEVLGNIHDNPELIGGKEDATV